MTETMTEPTTHTLDVPGARLTYDVRANDASTEPALLLIGAPMGASGFPSLASHFTDRTVITYDPRGVERSEKFDPLTESTPDEHADDISRLISELGVGPVDLFGSSGGAVNALALRGAASGPGPDGRRARAAGRPVPPGSRSGARRLRGHPRDLPAPWHGSCDGQVHRHREPRGSGHGRVRSSQPDPDPAMFGLPTEDDGSRNDALVGQNIVPLTHYEFDFDALRAGSPRIVIGVGVESGGQLARRAGEAVAAEARHRPGDVPEQPRRIPGQRVRSRDGGRPRRLRGKAARGPRNLARPAPRPRRAATLAPRGRLVAR